MFVHIFKLLMCATPKETQLIRFSFRHRPNDGRQLHVQGAL